MQLNGDCVSSMVEDAEQFAKQEQVTPLFSELANNGSEFDEIIDAFVGNLPELLTAIEATFRAGEYRKLAELAHNLKGLGGGFGYPQLTRLAAQIESLLIAQEYPDILPIISELYLLLQRIQLAHPS